MKCANPCPPGTFHIDCKKTCDCYNSAVCDHVTGRCHCRPGFKGDKVRLEGERGTQLICPVSSAQSSVPTVATEPAVSRSVAVRMERTVTQWMAAAGQSEGGMSPPCLKSVLQVSPGLERSDLQ